MPAHKSPVNMLAARHRIAMLKMAIEDDIRFELCDMEIKRGGISYTIDSIKELKDIYPHAELHFLIGSDSLYELHLWKDIHELLDLCIFDSFMRPGFDIKNAAAEKIKLDPPWPDRLVKNIHSGALADISSSNIRYRIAESMSIKYLVPSLVEMYITEHNLYGLDTGS
jgi:nicotinate-nucleotide adenylyltransferase